MSLDKPLIYFHPDENFDENSEISVTIRVENGEIREVWPDGGSLDGDSYTWPNFRISPNNSCGIEDVPTLYIDSNEPGGPLSAFCSQIRDGGVCETAEMHAYLGDVPHCILIDEIHAPVLLYNAYADPEQHSPVAADEHSVTNISDDPIGPLWATYMRSPQERLVYRIDRLEAGNSVLFADLQTIYTDDLHEELIQDIKESLQSAGLTDSESDDFINAWRPNVLALPRDVSNRTTPWAVFGFYDGETIDQIYPLSIDPMPDQVARVIGFTLEH